MWKMLAACLTAFLIITSAPVYAEEHGAARDRMKLPSEAEFKSMTDERIDLVKAALQLKPDQEKYWPPVEDAVRSGAMAWHARLEKMSERMKEMRDRNRDREFNPVAFMDERADALTQRAAGLKKLAEAWQPLYKTLDDTQKKRMRILTMAFFHEMRDTADWHRMEFEEGDED